MITKEQIAKLVDLHAKCVYALQIYLTTTGPDTATRHFAYIDADKNFREYAESLNKD